MSATLQSPSCHFPIWMQTRRHYEAFESPGSSRAHLPSGSPVACLATFKVLAMPGRPLWGGWRGRPGVAGTRPGVLWVTHHSPPRSVGACALAPGVCTVWIPAGVVQGCGWSLTEQSWLSCLPSRGLGGPRAAVHLDSFPPFILQTLLCHLPGLGSGPGGSRCRNLEPGEEAPGEEGVSGGICEVSGDDILGKSESPQEEFAGRPDARHKWVAPAGGMCFCMCGQRTPALLTAPAKGAGLLCPRASA